MRLFALMHSFIRERVSELQPFDCPSALARSTVHRLSYPVCVRGCVCVWFVNG